LGVVPVVSAFSWQIFTNFEEHQSFFFKLSVVPVVLVFQIERSVWKLGVVAVVSAFLGVKYSLILRSIKVFLEIVCSTCSSGFSD